MVSKKHIKISAIALIIISYFCCIPIHSSNAKEINSIPVGKKLSKDTHKEKRGNPTYDYIIGKDHLPHFRVFFWVSKEAKNYTPYADDEVKTDVSEHGPVEKWAVVETNEIKENEKLVFIYVPKTFVLLQGIGFQNKIHLRYD
ncbi:hypothetical protein [Clostridium fungisolvens]|uniref:Uncharacterized protein n=1 Tax=Clostridium fungisolvens TaxID=1604897 RepID=A0A6V8SAV2_9CLOT|nr:hypothetical protein [Clostridium fungisolvens]GFP74210.1 hypothetical protein bsdtw1_00255 [Clostridium fungisolvens]